MGKFDINNLNPAQKIGQIIMPRIDFNDPDSLPLAKRLVEECEVGGFIIFNGKWDVVAKATRELQSISNLPLLFGCDAERGLGQIVSGMTLFPFTMSLGAAGDEELAYDQASMTALEMRECGLNLLFAPVADVNSNPENPIINIRSNGDDPELVSRMCASFIRGCQEKGVMACAKHFPGHGLTGVDSHVDLPVLNTSLETLQSSDLIPFKKSIAAGVASIMTAHIQFAKIGDGTAATISKRLISNLLRNEMGFGGLVITDSLRMEGIRKLGDEEYISQRALEAGCDILLDPLDPLFLVANLEDLPGTELDELRLDSKVMRILSVKKEWLNQNASGESNIKETILKLRERIAEQSVCLLKGGKLKSPNAAVCVFDVTESGTDLTITFKRRLEENGVSLESISIPHVNPESPDTDNFSENTTIICLVYTTVGAWKKQSYLPDTFKTVLGKLQDMPNETVLISFGSPYVVRGFEKFDTVICGFDSLSECQVAAADVLSGKLRAKGRLPVRMG